MNKHPLVTAIIPVGPLNGNIEHLRSTLQECNQIEIKIQLICDDHKDGTRDELEKYIESNLLTNSELLYSDQHGPAEARNLGLSKVETDFVVFWDADDLPNPRLTLESLELAESATSTLICNQYSIVDLKNNQMTYTSRKRSTNLENYQAIGAQPGLWRFIFSSDLARKFRFIDSRMGEDQLYLTEILTLEPILHFSDLVTYKYFTSVPGQLTGSSKYVSDLRKIVPGVQSAIRNNRNESRVISQIILIQILIALLKRGSLRDRAFSALRLLKLATVHLTNFGRNLSTVFREKGIRREK